MASRAGDVLRGFCAAGRLSDDSNFPDAPLAGFSVPGNAWGLRRGGVGTVADSNPITPHP